MKTASITKRLASLGSERWAVHFEARRRALAGEDIIELTIGEPDVPTPPPLIEAAHQAMKAGRTRYAGGRGEAGLLEIIAAKYAARSGREITARNVLALPGTQAALAFIMMSLVEGGDAVLVPDPYYATYEGVVSAAGADFVPVPMSADNGFHLTVEQLEAAMVDNARVLLLNSPHNPTGATLSRDEIRAIGGFCQKHNLWIVSDEVYESLIYGAEFASPFDIPELADRVIALSSISKSHAAPGFRSGWCVGPAWVLDAAQGLAEALLFGNQPFIADMTAHALTHVHDTAAVMGQAYKRRIALLMEAFQASDKLMPLEPEAGMFMLVDVQRTGLSGHDFARALLDHGVGVMPGYAFGEQARNFIRLSLTVDDEKLVKAAQRIIAMAQNC